MEIIWDSLPRMFDGAVLTLEITSLSVAIGLVCAIPLALMRVSRNPLLWGPAYGYILYFRGTPLLVQLFLIYYGSGQFSEALQTMGLWVFFRDAWFCAVLTLTLNTAGYTAEILRGSIQAVPHGEVEAARACGMSGSGLYRRIILPKAFRLALPAYSNEVVFLEIYITAGIIYLIVTYGILYIFKKVEYRLSGHLRERKDTGMAAESAALR
jgi:octopine/nopaline transport system permease protein/arginine/ornithine transport system permease protein